MEVEENITVSAVWNIFYESTIANMVTLQNFSDYIQQIYCSQKMYLHNKFSEW